MRKIILCVALLFSASLQAEDGVSFQMMEKLGKCEALLGFIGFHGDASDVSDHATGLALKLDDTESVYIMGFAYGQGWGETREKLAALKRENEDSAKVEALDSLAASECKKIPALM